MPGFNTSVQVPVQGTSIIYDFPREALFPGQCYFVLYNQSPYICEVRTGNDVRWCAAFTADVFLISQTPSLRVIVTPQANLGSQDPIASQIFGTWYTNEEDIPLTTVPASLFGSTESIAVDRSTLISSGDAVSTTAFFVSSIIDVSQYQSFVLRVEYNAANAGPPANTLIVRPEWYEFLSGVGLVHQIEMEVNSINSTDCGPTIITDRMYARFMRLVMFTGNGPDSNATYRLYGSSRATDRLRMNEVGDGGPAGQGTDQCLVLATATVNAGATMFRNCRIGHGRATFLFRRSAAGGPWDVSLFSPDINSVGGVPYLSDNVPAGSGLQSYEITLPRRALTLRIINNGAGAGTVVATSVIVDND